MKLTLTCVEQPASERGFDATLCAWLKLLYTKFAINDVALRENIVRHALLHASP